MCYQHYVMYYQRHVLYAMCYVMSYVMCYVMCYQHYVSLLPVPQNVARSVRNYTLTSVATV